MAGEELLLSARDLRFEALRRKLVVVLAPALLLGILIWHPSNMAPKAVTLLAILAATLALWVTQALPVAVTALLGPALAVLFGVAPAQEVFAPFGHPLIFLFLGVFWLAAASERTRLDRLLASRLFADEHQTPERSLVRIALVTACLSSVLSRTATTAMMVPVNRSVVARLGPPSQAVGILNAAYASSIGGALTPIGNPANLIALATLSQLAHRPVPFLHWTLLALPLCVTTMAVWLLQVLWTLRRERRASRLIAGAPQGLAPLAGDALHVQPGQGPWGMGRGQTATVIILALALAGWTLPGLADILLTEDDWLVAKLHGVLPEGIVAILASAALFFLPASPRLIAGKIHRRPILVWPEALSIDWGTILLFGGVLALSQQVFQTGLAPWVGDLVLRASHVHSEAGLTVMFCLAGLVLGELGSSTATAATLCPLAVMTAQQLGLSPVAPVIAAGLAASMGMLMPASTAANAIAFGTGRVPLRTMMRYGLVLDLVAALVIPPSVLAVVDRLGLR